jgi:threonine synthase
VSPSRSAVALTWVVRCATCGYETAPEELRWRCACSGLLDLYGPAIDPTPKAGAPWSLWRYGAALAPVALQGAGKVTMGEGMSPLVPAPADRSVGTSTRVWLKLDYLMPTLSFKDRGAAVLIAAAAARGVARLVADSSGNAGHAVAAYAARAGIGAEVFVPKGTSASKVAAMRRFGADVRVVDGSRQDAAVAAMQRVEETDAFYASHVYQPLFVHGTKTFAYEVWEQSAGRFPATVVIGCGNGTLLLGAARGFASLAQAGLIDRVPKLVAVQSERCAPLLGRTPHGRTAAEGIAIASPPRRDQIVEAVRSSSGEIITAAEADLLPARRELAAYGIDVEPTASAVWAAFGAWARRPEAFEEGPVVVALCGAGAKSPGDLPRLS